MCILPSQAKSYVYLSDCKHGDLTSAGGQAPKQLLVTAAPARQTGIGREYTGNKTDTINRSKKNIKKQTRPQTNKTYTETTTTK